MYKYRYSWWGSDRPKTFLWLYNNYNKDGLQSKLPVSNKHARGGTAKYVGRKNFCTSFSFFFPLLGGFSLIPYVGKFCCLLFFSHCRRRLSSSDKFFLFSTGLDAGTFHSVGHFHMDYTMHLFYQKLFGSRIWLVNAPAFKAHVHFLTVLVIACCIWWATLSHFLVASARLSAALMLLSTRLQRRLQMSRFRKVSSNSYFLLFRWPVCPFSRCTAPSEV